MAIKDILVLLDPKTKAAGPYALSIAAAFRAHVTAAALGIDPTIPTFALAEVPAELLSMAREDARKVSDGLLRDFTGAAQMAGVVAETLTIEATRDRAEAELARLARHFDLMVVQQADPDAPGVANAMIEAALFGSGRPVLVVPYIHRAPATFRNVLVAWDMSAPAARTVGDAMPILAEADRVEVVTIAEGKIPENELPGFNIARHLARHGINAELKRLTSVGDVANTLLSHAADAGTDLLVMGGYGHSRMREFVLGGATRGILQSMTVPVLMAH